MPIVTPPPGQAGDPLASPDHANWAADVHTDLIALDQRLASHVHGDLEPPTLHAALSGLDADDHPQYVNVTGDTMTGILVLPADPTQPMDAATKQYADTAGPRGGGIGSFTATTLPTGQQTSLLLAQTYLNGLTLDTNLTTLTVVQAGWYNVSGRVGLSGSVGTGRAFMSANIGGRDFRVPTTVNDTLAGVTAMARCVVGDKIYFQALQTTGASLTANTGGHWFVKYLGNE